MVFILPKSNKKPFVMLKSAVSIALSLLLATATATTINQQLIAQEDPLEFKQFISELSSSDDLNDALFLSIFTDPQLQLTIENVAKINPESMKVKKGLFCRFTLNDSKTSLF